MTKLVAAALVIVGFLAFNHAQAAGFTGKQFLLWDKEDQHGFIDISITMTGVVATQGRKDISRCIDAWYSGKKEVQKQRRGHILDTIRNNPSYHPQGVILAVLQKQCGSFKDKPN